MLSIIICVLRKQYQNIIKVSLRGILSELVEYKLSLLMLSTYLEVFIVY